jgi:hypothetical protein
VLEVPPQYLLQKTVPGPISFRYLAVTWSCLAKELAVNTKEVRVDAVSVRITEMWLVGPVG